MGGTTVIPGRWEDAFATWASPPSRTEQDRCDNAVRAIRNAVEASEELRGRKVRVFLHGSYRNNVNVRQNSDVDVGVLCSSVFFSSLPDGRRSEEFGIVDGDYDYPAFKDAVGRALVKYFGSGAVRRGNKAFDIKANSYHVEADVAPFLEHRRYSSDGRFLSGVELRPDSGGQVINWPEQHYENGVQKNEATSRAYKGAVRILKKVCANLQEANVALAMRTSGFVIECMGWNTPNQMLLQSTWRATIQDTIAHLWERTKADESCAEWGEVSELKYLFKSNADRRVSAHDFLAAAWSYLTS